MVQGLSLIVRLAGMRMECNVLFLYLWVVEEIRLDCPSTSFLRQKNYLVPLALLRQYIWAISTYYNLVFHRSVTTACGCGSCDRAVIVGSVSALRKVIGHIYVQLIGRFLRRTGITTATPLVRGHFGCGADLSNTASAAFTRRCRLGLNLRLSANYEPSVASRGAL